MHQPGEKWMYHTGSDVLGVLIARASGQPLETFLRERLFEPLGMRDTGFSVPPQKLDRLATSYWTNFETGAFELYDNAEGGQWSRPPAFPSGAGDWFRRSRRSLLLPPFPPCSGLRGIDGFRRSSSAL
jgi:CubicO group peptidase (beta-lactamase class C family)